MRKIKAIMASSVAMLGLSHFEASAIASTELMGEADAVAEPQQTKTRTVALCPIGGSSTSIDPWKAVEAVQGESQNQPEVLSAKGGYSIGAPGKAKLISAGQGKLKVEFGPGSKSHCSSATAMAFYTYIAELVNTNKLQLNTAQLKFLNGNIVNSALYGNTWSMALLVQHFGGSSVIGKQSDSSVKEALSQAKPGDILKFDRPIRGVVMGHSTYFKEIKGNQVCFWSSNTSTKGLGVKCESINNLIQVAVTRYPSDPSEITRGINLMMKTTQIPGSRLAKAFKTPTSGIQASDVKWDDTLSISSGTQVACDNSNSTDQVASIGEKNAVE